MESLAIVPASDTPSASSDPARLEPLPHHQRQNSLAHRVPLLPPLPHLHRRRPSPPSCNSSSNSAPNSPLSFSPPSTTPTDPTVSAPTVPARPPSSTLSSLSLAASVPVSTSSLPCAVLAPPKPEQRFARPLSVDSPTLYEFSSPGRPPLPLYHQHLIQPASTHAATPEAPSIPLLRQHSDPHPAELSDVLSEYDDLISDSSVPDADADAPCRGTPPSAAEDTTGTDEVVSQTDLLPSPMLVPRPVPPHLSLDQVDTSLSLQSNPESHSSKSARLSKPPPKSPSQASPFASLFGGGNPSPSVTDFSSIPSPVSPTRKASTDDALRTDQVLPRDADADAAKKNPLNYCESFLFTPPPSQALSPLQVDEMEEELKAISSELAASIRREMDLEDLVDRLQLQVGNPQAPSKRTSDYFSDSGNSSAKLSESEQSRDEIEKIQRRAEQEKASIRLELTNKLQDERSKRKALDQQIKDLAEKASQMDLAQINSLGANDQVRDLEKTCEVLRRRLSDERQSKTNIEDLLSALKGELQDACKERDNLRDEVVPQLRARVEGLESEAASYATLTYESTKMQQQLLSLQQENSSLRNNAPAAVSEDATGLTRSNSLAAGSFRPRAPHALDGLKRSESVKNMQAESREQLAERLKDVEAQRDALHSALKNLLERQEFQNRENQKKIQILERERQRLLADSPKKVGFEREIANLRTEINVLRRRAEDALEQKWQMEKGLVGLKMDLDKAEEEITSLQDPLREKDILIPPSAAPVSSESLERAYRELQDAYGKSLERVKRLELGHGNAVSDEKTRLAVQRLEQSLAAAVFERDAVKQQASYLQDRIDGLKDIESNSVERETGLADEICASAQRVEQLAAEVRQQLLKNAELRSRLSDTVARGDAERKANSDRISGLQERLHALEEQLVAAQTASEERVGRHEEEISQLREAHNEQLRRINQGVGVGRTSAPKSPLLQSEASRKMLGRASQAISPKSFEDEARIEALRERVGELEKALADAETEIQQVVAKMSTAQIEVMNLQEEREAAVRETKRLQKVLATEQAKAVDKRFKTLNGMVN